MHSFILGEMSNAIQLEHFDFFATSGSVFQCFAAFSQYFSSERLKDHTEYVALILHCDSLY